MLFIQYEVLSNYADDNFLFLIGKNKEEVYSLILLDPEIVNHWFYGNFMVLNPGKSHYICLGKNVDDNEVFNCNGLTIKSSKEARILGMKIDNNLNVNNRIKSVVGKQVKN